MNPRFFSSPAIFRRWLEKNHSGTDELLIGFYRKESGKGGMTYPDALDEALCFGWIDGVRRRFDESSYVIRFTPRKKGSIWSAVNIERVGKLVELGHMHPVGRKIFDERDQKKSNLYSYERSTCQLTSGYMYEFRANKKAWTFYQAQPPGYRRLTCWWVMSAKREETRARRLLKLIQDCAKGRRLDQFISKAPK